MPKYTDVIYEFLVRLPFFFAAHTVMLYFFKDTSTFTPIVLFLSFALVFAFDMLVKKPRLATLFALITGGLLFLLKLPATAVLVWCVTVFKNYLNAQVQLFFWIAFHLIVSIFVPPSERMTAMAYILLMAMSLMICGLTERLGVFMHSNFCREASRKTVANVIARHYRLIVPLLLLTAAVGFAVMLPHYPEDIQISERSRKEPVPRPVEQQEFGSLEIPQAEDDYEETPIVEDPEWAETFRKILKIIGQIIGFIFAGILLLLLFLPADKKETDFNFEDYPEDMEEGQAGTEAKRTRGRIRLPGLNWVVRRLFYIKVRRQRRRGLFPKISDTPNAIAEEINKVEDISGLNRLYHRARYSDEEIKRSDLSEMRTSRQGAKQQTVSVV